MLTKNEAAEFNAKYLEAVRRAVSQVESTGSIDVTEWPIVALMKVQRLPVVHDGDHSEAEFDTGRMASKGAQVRAFLEQLYKLGKNSRIDDGIDLIIGQIDEWLMEGKTDLCEFALAQVQEDCLQEDLVFSFVTATLAAKKVLERRPGFIRRAKARIAAIRGQDFADNLMAHYE